MIEIVNGNFVRIYAHKNSFMRIYDRIRRMRTIFFNCRVDIHPFEKVQVCSNQQRALSKTSPIDVSSYFSRNAEHSESNMRSVMKKPKIIKKYPRRYLVQHFHSIDVSQEAQRKITSWIFFSKC